MDHQLQTYIVVAFVKRVTTVANNDTRSAIDFIKYYNNIK